MKWFFILIVIAGIAGNFVHSDSIDLGTSNNDPVIGTTKITSQLGNVLATIGDPSNNTFQPSLRITRKFFEDANLTITWNEPSMGSGSASVLIDNKMVKYKKTGMELWFYQLQDTQDTPEGGFEFMAVMNSKPQTNTINFKINSNNLDFFYQGPLKAEGEFVNYTCNATACLNGSMIMAERPLNIVGSYAVYHSSKKNNQYTTGKVAHIYRPYVVDSLGTMVWADLNISGATMTITIPQKFLDNAVYPIYIDPSIGYATIGGSYANWAGDSIRGNYVYTPATDGNLTTMNVYKGIGTSGPWRGIVYINSTNAVRAFTSSFQQVASADWESTSFNNGTTTIFASTNYILGIWLGTSPNIVSMYYDSGGTNYARGTQTYSNSSPPTDPQTWGSGKPVAGTQYHYSMYANYTESGTSFTPAFNITITSPANGSTYTYPYNFTYNFTAIGNASTYDIKYRLDSNGNVTYGNVANDTNIFHSLGNLSAGIHSLVVYATNGTVTNTSNNITFTINRTSMPIYQLLNGAWQNLTITYPTSSNASGYKNIAEGTLTLYRNGTSYTIPNIETLGTGVWNYTLYFAQTENYTTNSTSLFVTVNQNNSYSLSIGIVPSTTITFGTQTTVTGSGCPSGVTCTLYRNGIGVTNPYTSTEGAGSINFEYNTTGNENYSSKTVSQTLTVNKYTQFCNATIDGVWQNKTITYGTSATMNGSSSNVSGLLYRNGTSVSYPQTITSGAGVWNYTFYSAGNANFTSCSESVFLTVNKATPSLSVTLAPSDTVIYPQQTTATGVGCTAPLSCTLYRGTTTVANPDINSYSVGSYNYIYNTTGNENYTSASGSNLLTVNQNTTWWLNITVAPSATVTFGTQTNVTGIRCPAELTCNLLRNGTAVTNSDVQTLGVGSYNYTYYSSGNGNYGPASSNQTVTVNQYSQWCNLTINGTEGNKTYIYGTPTNATGYLSNLTSGTLYRNGTGVSNPELATLAVGVWNYTIIENGNQNYTSCFKTYFVQINSTIADSFIQTVNLNHPLNGSIFVYPYNLTAYFNITGNASTYIAKYNLDDGANNTLGSIANNTNTTIGLGILLGGWHNVTVCATNSTENCSTSFFFINFTDSTPPAINITSPLNATYTQCSNNILLNATANESVVAWWFSLNGGVNTSFTPTVYITAINGSNNITVWANDSSGNIGYNTTYFTLNLTICPTPIPSNATNIIVVLDAKPTGDNNIMYLGIMGLLFLGIGGYFFMNRKGGSDQAQPSISLTDSD